uniref:Ribonuclease H protein At1g65750 family n=1 Tax=Cajanus cajan TaxID=3821 RepID=A0A151SSX2_CAJCA|nr:Putative ribonuclease H protein At1g65750 family [Cajanus cajan]
MGLDTLCQCCHQTVEDAFHIFFGCDVTVSLWQSVFPRLVLPQWSTINWFLWLKANIDEVARQERHVTCLQASQGQVTVHVDGSALGSPGPAGYGGLCRDNFGRWLMGFYGDAGVGDNLKAELLAILHGMKLAWRANFRNILCVSDSLLAVNLVLGPLDVLHKYAPIIAHIKELLQQSWSVCVCHSFREGNQSADFLSKLGPHCGVDLVVLDTIPEGLHPFVTADAAGTVFRRM